MSIDYKDFPRGSKMLGLGTGPFKTAVEAANKWISTENIKVINVETLVNQAGPAKLDATHEGVRVWYRKD